MLSPDFKLRIVARLLGVPDFKPPVGAGLQGVPEKDPCSATLRITVSAAAQLAVLPLTEVVTTGRVALELIMDNSLEEVSSLCIRYHTVR